MEIIYAGMPVNITINCIKNNKDLEFNTINSSPILFSQYAATINYLDLKPNEGKVFNQNDQHLKIKFDQIIFSPPDNHKIDNAFIVNTLSFAYEKFILDSPIFRIYRPQIIKILNPIIKNGENLNISGIFYLNNLLYWYDQNVNFDPRYPERIPDVHYQRIDNGGVDGPRISSYSFKVDMKTLGLKTLVLNESNISFGEKQFEIVANDHTPSNPQTTKISLHDKDSDIKGEHSFSQTIEIGSLTNVNKERLNENNWYENNLCNQIILGDIEYLEKTFITLESKDNYRMLFNSFSCETSPFHTAIIYNVTKALQLFVKLLAQGNKDKTTCKQLVSLPDAETGHNLLDLCSIFSSVENFTILDVNLISNGYFEENGYKFESLITTMIQFKSFTLVNYLVYKCSCFRKYCSLNKSSLISFLDLKIAEIQNSIINPNSSTPLVTNKNPASNVMSSQVEDSSSDDLIYQEKKEPPINILKVEYNFKKEHTEIPQTKSSENTTLDSLININKELMSLKFLIEINFP